MTNSTEIPKAVNLEFLQNHIPSLAPGDYTLTVSQTIQGTAIPENTAFSSSPFYFSVLGERFAISPDQIQAVFPPTGSLGDYSAVLPHITLNRSTLPWERQAMPFKDSDTPDKKTVKANTPWLALLVFYPGELEQWEGATPHEAELGKVATLSDLRAPSTGWPGLPDPWEVGMDNADKTTVIYVKQSILKDLLPTAGELQYLAHIRQGTDADGKLVGIEQAFIIANRLPERTGQSMIHLVSVEKRYGEDQQFDFGKANADDLITLVSLKSWRIACIDPDQTFEYLIKNLDAGPPTLPIPASAVAKPAAEFLKMGYVPLPHFFRRGGQSISWYHGPLAPGKYFQGIHKDLFPFRSSDDLLRFDEDLGLFDVSYAAAWELGRLLALKSKPFSTSLYKWKRENARLAATMEQQILFPHLPRALQQPSAKDQTRLPELTGQWLDDLSRLNGVPFNYLIPDEQMLPKESLRFFYLDPVWVDCLLDGAFSIGGVTAADRQRDASLRTNLGTTTFKESGFVSGCLLRSSVVAGWPDMQVNAYQHNFSKNELPNEMLDNGLKPLSIQRLSPQVLLCLFQGQANVFDFYLKPEVLHFGVNEVQNSNPVQYGKNLRYADGTELQDKQQPKKAIGPLTLSVNTGRKVDINGLFNSMAGLKKQLNFKGDFTSAQFALEMIEGVPNVRFIRNDTT